jgi:N6-L-threonylcarbamoyladenine synthase
LLDQFGRAIGFASPCGNRIEELAGQSGVKYMQLPYVIKGNDVSFSGLLTAAVKLASQNAKLTDACYSLQETAFAMLAEAIERALSFTGKNEMMLVGGVAANKRLARMLEIACERQNAKLFVCPIQFAGDNGAQIAWTALREYHATKINVPVEKSTVRQSWRLDTVDVSWRH